MVEVSDVLKRQESCAAKRVKVCLELSLPSSLARLKLLRHRTGAAGHWLLLQTGTS